MPRREEQFIGDCRHWNWPAANAFVRLAGTGALSPRLKALRPSPQAVSALSGDDHLSWDALQPALPCPAPGRPLTMHPQQPSAVE